jgi:hypothetical protein
MPTPHNKIIADTAKAALGPLGFFRKGCSRTWLADHGWWLTVVEFQPSAWSKGSYLNVAAHWLWSELGNVSFDYGGRLLEFVEYKSDAQFASATARLAEGAAHEARRLAEAFSSIRATGKVLLNEARTGQNSELGHPGWAAYNAGVAAGLAGRARAAAEMFSSVLDSSAPAGSVLYQAAERMARLLAEPDSMRSEVTSLVTRQREALRLPPLSQDLNTAWS